MSQQACTVQSVTNTTNGTSCATCKGSTQKHKMNCGSHEHENSTPQVTPFEVCVDPLHSLSLRIFPKQITSSRTVWISTMFCVVAPGSKSGDVLKASTAASTRHVSQPASRLVKSWPRLLMRRFTNSLAENCEVNVDPEFIVERVMSPPTTRKD